MPEDEVIQELVREAPRPEAVQEERAAGQRAQGRRRRRNYDGNIEEMLRQNGIDVIGKENLEKLEKLAEERDKRNRERLKQAEEEIFAQRKREDLEILRKRRQEDSDRRAGYYKEVIRILSMQLNAVENNLRIVKKRELRVYLLEKAQQLYYSLEKVKMDAQANFDDQVWDNRAIRRMLIEWEPEKKELLRQERFMLRENLEEWQRSGNEKLPPELYDRMIFDFVQDWLTGSYEISGMQYRVRRRGRRRGIFTELSRNASVMEELNKPRSSNNVYKTFFLTYIVGENTVEPDFTLFTTAVQLFEKMSPNQLKAYIESVMAAGRNRSADQISRIVEEVTARKHRLREDMREFLTEVIKRKYPRPQEQQKYFNEGQTFRFEDEGNNNPAGALQGPQEEAGVPDRLQREQLDLLVEEDNRLYRESGNLPDDTRKEMLRRFMTKKIYIALMSRVMAIEQAGLLLDEDGYYRLPELREIEARAEKMDEPENERIGRMLEEAFQEIGQEADDGRKKEARDKKREALGLAVRNRRLTAKSGRTRREMGHWLDRDGRFIFAEERRERELEFMEQANLEHWSRNRWETVPNELSDRIVSDFLEDWLTGSIDINAADYLVAQKERNGPVFNRLAQNNIMEALASARPQNVYRAFFFSYMKEENETRLDYKKLEQKLRVIEGMNEAQIKAYVKTTLFGPMHCAPGEEEDIINRIIERKGRLRNELQDFLTALIKGRNNSRELQQLLENGSFRFRGEGAQPLEQEDVAGDDVDKINQLFMALVVQAGDDTPEICERCRMKVTGEIYAKLLGSRISRGQAAGLLDENGFYRQPPQADIRGLLEQRWIEKLRRLTDIALKAAAGPANAPANAPGAENAAVPANEPAQENAPAMSEGSRDYLTRLVTELLAKAKLQNTKTELARCLGADGKFRIPGQQ